MRGFRKFVGLFIIIFIGIPTLFAAIWGVGLTRAVVSPEFLSDLPRELMDKVPRLMDEALEIAAREGEFDDERTRQWVKAFADAETSPRDLLDQVGVIDWMNNEATQAVDDLGKTLRGERRPRPIMLNLRPLKQALKHEGIKEYIKEVLHKLPECDTDQTAVWVDSIINGVSTKLPACQPPEFEKALELVRVLWNEKVDEIPDEVDIFKIDEDEDFFPFTGIDIAKLAVALTYFLFFIPAMFIFLGAWIGGGSGQKVLRWSGISTLVGGLLSLGLAKFTGSIVEWASNVGHVRFSDYPLDEVGEVFAEKVGDLIIIVMDKLFSTVNTVAGTVCIVGIVLIALSYAITSRDTSRPSRNGGSSNQGGSTQGGSGSPGPQPSAPSAPAPGSQSPPSVPANNAVPVETGPVDAVPIDSTPPPAVPPDTKPPVSQGNSAIPLKPGDDSK